MATYNILTVEEQTGPGRPILDRIETSCPRCGYHDVEVRDA
jgi:hypothetical protein